MKKTEKLTALMCDRCGTSETVEKPEELEDTNWYVSKTADLCEKCHRDLKELQEAISWLDTLGWKAE